MPVESRPDTQRAARAAESMRAVWRSVLAIDEVAEDSHFFELGGHSMLATRLMSRVQKALGVELPVQLIFDHPVFGDFVTSVLAVTAGAEPRVVGGGGATSAPLSLQQQELMAMEAALGWAPANNATAVATVPAAVDPALLRAALRLVVERHPMLRAIITAEAEGFVQRLAPVPAEPPLSMIDLSGRPPADTERELRRALRRAHLTAFELAGGSLLRVQLFRRAPEDHVLAVHLHHAAGDGESLRLLFEDLAACYGALAEGRSPRPAPALSYLDYVRWQEQRAPEAMAHRRAAWRATVRALAADLPADTERLPVGLPLGRWSTRVRSEALAPLRQWVAAEGGTDFTAVALAVAVVSARLRHRSRIGVGTVLDNRGLPDFDGVIGPFATSTLLAVAVQPEASARQVLAAVREQLGVARASAGLPLECLLREPAEELYVNPSGLVDVVVSVDRVERPIAAYGLPLTLLPDDGEPLVPLALAPTLGVFGLVGPDGDLHLVVEFPDEPRRRAHAVALLDGTAMLLARIAVTPDAPLSSAPTAAGKP
ncbi:condensation domain-containing protein [Micromonospora sp. NPDC048868]|uniref:condensation domain-containing protein n=1 Tax=Micromonospora sp. NPDC048868 TaxID=3364258 RepID=UPI003723072D